MQIIKIITYNMKKDTKSLINVQGSDIAIISNSLGDYICLTDMAKKFGGEDLIYGWMRNRNTLEFLGIWEQIHNFDFKGVEFDTFRKEAGLNSFRLTPKKWILATKAIGIKSKAGRYGGGTYAHKDIAFEFGTWLSPGFKMYLIKEFQRLKDNENKALSLNWNINRILSKLSYKLQTQAIRENIIPANLTREQINYIYADEADILNVALFGKTAKQWRDENRDKEGNIRDYATIEQLLVLSNIESINAEYIRTNMPQEERLVKLNSICIFQMRVLTGSGISKRFESLR
jgi:hypothetical protein